jgi:hypothetical protein
MSFNSYGPELMAEAERIVKPQYPTAVQVENFGTSSKGSASTSDEIDQWKFVFTDIDGLEIITLDYERGKFGKAVRDARPWIKTLIKELPRNLPFNQALSYLRSAGHNEPILSVTLRAPFPLEKAATYVFQMKKKTVYMDALGGEVTRVVED